MATKIEKEFFDTFGIEPKYETHSCDGWGRTVEIRYFKDKKDADKFGMVLSEPKYPQITDKRYLELICVLNNATNRLRSSITVYELNIDSLKQQILKKLMLVNKMYSDKHLAGQIQAIFEE